VGDIIRRVLQMQAPGALLVGGVGAVTIPPFSDKQRKRQPYT
jgi:hypothetical protein